MSRASRHRALLLVYSALVCLKNVAGPGEFLDSEAAAGLIDFLEG